jgi:hypothetical protein
MLLAMIFPDIDDDDVTLPCLRIASVHIPLPTPVYSHPCLNGRLTFSVQLAALDRETEVAALKTPSP